jgi:hypothetical protein
MDERVKVDLDPEDALRLLLAAESEESDDSDDAGEADQDAE